MDIMTREEFIKEYCSHTLEFCYRILSRMKSDCEYYINVEMPHNCPTDYNHLWAHHDPKAQITYMRYLWEYLEEKPEWLTMEEINEYAKAMEVE